MDEISSGIRGLFSDIESVEETDHKNGKEAWKKELKFPTIQLDNTGKNIGFRPLEKLQEDNKKWGNVGF